MHLFGEGFNALGEFPGDFGELGVLFQQLGQHGVFLGGEDLSFFAGLGEVFPVLGVGLRVHFVAIGLTGLRQQDERCGIGGLKTEREVQEDERIKVKLGDAEDVQANPE